MKIMLVDPPAREDDYDKAYPNLGILQLISYVVEQTPLVDDDVVFLDQFNSLEDHIRQIEEHRPAVYGISFAFLTQRLAYYTINEIKKRFPDMLIIAGGPHPTSVPEDVLENTAADMVCIGEGETFMAEVVNKVHAGDFDFSKTLGVLHRVDEKLVNTGRRPSVADLDSLPFMAWDRIDFTKFVGQHYCKSTRQSCIVVSRGCPYHCTFCSLPVWRVSKPSVRMRSPENIAAEVQWQYELGVREIKIVSDELNITLPWAKNVCRAIADLDHKDLYFQTNLRADKMDNELAALFADMNMWLVHLGCESSSDRVLTGIQKKISIKQVEDTLVWLKRNNIRCLLFMMMFNMWEEKGELQFERPREVLRSLFWSWKQFLLGRMQYMTWSVTTPMPGAPLYDIVQRHGLDQTDDVLDHWDLNKDYLGINLTSLGVPEWKKMWLLRMGILSKAFFMMISGQFDWRRHFFRVGILLRSFTGRWRVVRARKSGAPPLFAGTALRTKVEG